MKFKLLKFGVGYIIAVTVAVVVAEAILLAPTVLPDNGRYGSFYRNLQDLPGMFAVGLIYTFATALPGFLITIYVAYRNDMHSRKFYCVAGILTALLAHLLLAAFIGAFVMTSYIVIVCSLPGGAAGAYAFYKWRYWLMKPRQVGPESGVA